MNVRKPEGADMSSGKYKKSINPAGILNNSVDEKSMPKLPYMTLDSISPIFKKLSLRLLVCDYIKCKGLDRGKGAELFRALLEADPITERCELDSASRPVIIIEGEKKALTLKAVNDAHYFQMLDEYTRHGRILSPAKNRVFTSLGVAGVWFAKKQSDNLNDELVASLRIKGRHVGICFDRDAAQKKQVAMAFIRGARALKGAGAKAVRCRLALNSTAEDASAKGLDDEIMSKIKGKADVSDQIGLLKAQNEAFRSFRAPFLKSFVRAHDGISHEHASAVVNAASAEIAKMSAKMGVSKELPMSKMPLEIQDIYWRVMADPKEIDKYSESAAKKVQKSEREAPCPRIA